MDGGLADGVRMVVQWLFGPLLALVALAANRIENVKWRMENEGERCWE